VKKRAGRWCIKLDRGTRAPASSAGRTCCAGGWIGQRRDWPQPVRRLNAALARLELSAAFARSWKREVADAARHRTENLCAELGCHNPDRHKRTTVLKSVTC